MAPDDDETDIGVPDLTDDDLRDPIDDGGSSDEDGDLNDQTQSDDDVGDEGGC